MPSISKHRVPEVFPWSTEASLRCFSEFLTGKSPQPHDHSWGFCVVFLDSYYKNILSIKRSNYDRLYIIIRTIYLKFSVAQRAWAIVSSLQRAFIRVSMITRFRISEKNRYILHTDFRVSVYHLIPCQRMNFQAFPL